MMIHGKWVNDFHRLYTVYTSDPGLALKEMFELEEMNKQDIVLSVFHHEKNICILVSKNCSRPIIKEVNNGTKKENYSQIEGYDTEIGGKV